MGKPQRAESDQRPGSVFNVRYALGFCAQPKLESSPEQTREMGFIDSCRTKLPAGTRIAAAHRCSGAPVFQSKPSSGTTMSRSKVSILMSRYFSVGGAHAKFS